MSKAIDNIYKLYNNPFILTPLVVEFYSNFQSRDKDILLSNLVLPIALFESSKLALQRADNRRTLITFRRDNQRMYGLQARVQEYKEITRLCVQCALDNKLIEISDTLSVSVKNKIDCDQSLKSASVASGNLAKMLNKYDIVSAYRLLGIKKL